LGRIVTWDSVWRPRGLSGLDPRRKVFWVDTHCHLQSLSRPVEELIGRAVAAGVERVVCVGTDRATSLAAIALACVHDGVWATVGLHPHDASRVDDEWPTLVDAAIGERVVAIGEAGLDYHYDHSPRDVQRDVFARHVRLANEQQKPLVIHTREAWDDTFEILDREGVPARTIFHCFTGGPDEAKRCVAIDAYVSFSGIVTFRKSDELRAAVREVPEDRVLVETDAPYLSPVPHRGRENEPSYVPFVGSVVAAARRESVEMLAASTRANSFRVFWPEEI
jgi:TatD DNase family protein